MATITDFPVGPVVFVNANNVDGVSNDIAVHGSSIPTWYEQGNSGINWAATENSGDGTNSTIERGSPLLKSDDNEESVSFDGSYSILTAPGSAATLGFFHQTGVFDLLIVIRRRAISPEYSGTPGLPKRRIFGGSDGNGNGLIISLTDSFVEDGDVGALLTGPDGIIADIATTVTTEFATPSKIMIRGTGSELKISNDFYRWQSTTYATSPGGVADAQFDYSIGGAKPLQVYPLLFEGDYVLIAAWNRNLSTAELTQIRASLEEQIGEGI